VASDILEGAGDAVIHCVGVALSPDLFVLDLALGLRFLARRLQRFKTSHISNRLLHLSGCVLDILSHLATKEHKIAVESSSDSVDPQTWLANGLFSFSLPGTTANWFSVSLG
jgi:hypothetical protein